MFMRELGIAVLVCLLMTGKLLLAQEPELSLSQAIQIAVMNNRLAKIAQLDITKAEWEVAATKTKRLPSTSAYLFGGGNLTSPSFTFKQGVFGTVNGNPVPSTNTQISLSQG